MIIVRGIPGSGKSFKSKQLAPISNIFSTDSYWLNEKNEYVFDRAKLHTAHKWNIARVETALQEHKTPIVIDNTNITKKEYKPYILLAYKYNYAITYALPDSPWFLDILPRLRDQTFTDADVHIFFEKNSHDVPFEVIKNMMKNWEE